MGDEPDDVDHEHFFFTITQRARIRIRGIAADGRDPTPLDPVLWALLLCSSALEGAMWGAERAQDGELAGRLRRIRERLVEDVYEALGGDPIPEVFRRAFEED